MMVLATGKTTTTWMLSVLSYTTVAGGYMTAAEEQTLAHVLSTRATVVWERRYRST